MAETPAASAETVQAAQAAPTPEARQAALKQRATAWWDALIRDRIHGWTISKRSDA